MDNSLAKVNPELAKEWHPTKNYPLTPEDVPINSGKMVWWYLHHDDFRTGKHYDFEWQDRVILRHHGANCPFLNKAGKTPVYCIELNMTFDSVAEAAQYIGFPKSSIYNYLHGKTKRGAGFFKLPNGIKQYLHWEWASLPDGDKVSIRP